MGRYEEAIREMQKGWLLSGESVYQAGVWANALLRAWKKDGEKGFWRKQLQFLQEREQHSSPGYFRAVDMVFVYAKLGNNDKAFEWLDKAYENREGYEIPGIRCSPRFRNLQVDPRLARLAKRMGLPD